MANEKRLIGYDPTAFGAFTTSLRNTLEVYDPYSDGYEDGVGRVEDWLEFNSVDAVEVVRCKDCKHWQPCDSMAGNSIDDMQRVGGCGYVRYRRLPAI